MRREFSGHYAVPFFVDRTAVAVFSVAVFATNVVIVDGRVTRDSTKGGGGEFTPNGVPADWDAGLPVEPEQVVRFIFMMTDVKVREVPQLVRFRRTYGPLINRWVVTLERAVEFISLDDGSIIATDVVHVSAHDISIDPDDNGPRLALRVFAATSEQPETEDIPVPQFDSNGNVINTVTYAAPVRPSAPISLLAGCGKTRQCNGF